MHCLEINMTKYISLSSVIAKKLNFVSFRTHAFQIQHLMSKQYEISEDCTLNLAEFTSVTVFSYVNEIFLVKIHFN